MKYFVFIIIYLFFVLPAFVSAETMYVSDIMKVTVRTGPGVEHKIVAILQSTDKVNVIEFKKDWSYVRLPDGKEGWIITRFITSEKPSQLLLESLQKKYDALIKTHNPMLKENKKLKQENKKILSEFAKDKKAFERLDQSYENLKNESKNFLRLKENYQKSTSKLAEQTQKAERLEEELTKLLLHQNIKWFLSGAGVLVLGCILGYATKRQRRTSRF